MITPSTMPIIISIKLNGVSPRQAWNRAPVQQMLLREVEWHQTYLLIRMNASGVRAAQARRRGRRVLIHQRGNTHCARRKGGTLPFPPAPRSLRVVTKTASASLRSLQGDQPGGVATLASIPFGDNAAHAV